MAKRGPKFSRFVLNCGPSRGIETDWSFEDAVTAQSEAASILTMPLQVVGGDLSGPLPGSIDLREPWWKIQDQGKTGACVGFATADGVLRW